MKKKLTSLSLNKKSISNLGGLQKVKGGTKQLETISCVPYGICCPTHDTDCPTNTCGGTGNVLTADCNTNQEGCTVPTFSVVIC
ncbi:MAG: hypothetical protein AB8B65_09120 [Kordia sp.]|uniref:hypothetical protein n=1 Tax=Kordia sp. TaxID=1965332 RepID=UPI00385D396B